MVESPNPSRLQALAKPASVSLTELDSLQEVWLTEGPRLVVDCRICTARRRRVPFAGQNRTATEYQRLVHHIYPGYSS